MGDIFRHRLYRMLHWRSYHMIKQRKHHWATSGCPRKVRSRKRLYPRWPSLLATCTNPNQTTYIEGSKACFLELALQISSELGRQLTQGNSKLPLLIQLLHPHFFWWRDIRLPFLSGDWQLWKRKGPSTFYIHPGYRDQRRILTLLQFQEIKLVEGCMVLAGLYLSTSLYTQCDWHFPWERSIPKPSLDSGTTVPHFVESGNSCYHSQPCPSTCARKDAKATRWRLATGHLVGFYDSITEASLTARALWRTWAMWKWKPWQIGIAYIYIYIYFIYVYCENHACSQPI